MSANAEAVNKTHVRDDAARSAPTLLSRLDWRLIAYAGLFILLFYQVALPFLMIVWTSLKTVPGRARISLARLDIAELRARL